jgi:hypothetical protein
MPNPRKPDALKKLEGTFRKDRSEPGAPDLKAIPVPAPPEGMDAVERQAWADLKQDVDALGVMSEADLLAFRFTVDAIADYRREKACADPNRRLLVELRKEAKSWLAVFGITPQSRGTVRQLRGTSEESELSEFFN